MSNRTRAAAVAVWSNCVPGSWLRSRGPGSSICCKAYSALPPSGSCLYTMEASICFGPVHEVHTCEMNNALYVAVMVPSSIDMDVLVSVNIWSSHNQHKYEVPGGVTFATPVPWREQASWYSSGWFDHWVSGYNDMNELGHKYGYSAENGWSSDSDHLEEYPINIYREV